MKNKIFTTLFLGVFCLAFLVVGVLAAKPDFNGKWKLDAAKSEGLPPGMEQTMNVKQNGDEINIETTVKMPQGEQTVPDSYSVTGKEVEFTKEAPNGQKQKVKRISKWTESGMEVVEQAQIETPDGAATVTAKRKWTLSADGKTLIIEMDVEGPQGKQTSKRTFVKSNA